MAQLKKNLQRLTILTLVATLCCSIAYGADDACTVNLTIEPYMYVDIVKDVITMEQVRSYWFSDGNTHESHGGSGIDVKTNVNAHVFVPGNLLLLSPDSEIPVDATVIVLGDNEAYEWLSGHAVNYDPGIDLGGTVVQVSTGDIPWELDKHWAGTYSGTLMLTLSAGHPGPPGP